MFGLSKHGKGQRSRPAKSITVTSAVQISETRTFGKSKYIHNSTLVSSHTWKGDLGKRI